jgi:hypothetical protein
VLVRSDVVHAAVLVDDRPNPQARSTTSPISTLLIVMASPPGGLALSISAAACADSSDSNVSIDVPVFSSSLTHCAETKPGAWRIRGIPSCLKKLLACSKSWSVLLTTSACIAASLQLRVRPTLPHSLTAVKFPTALGPDLGAGLHDVVVAPLGEAAHAVDGIAARAHNDDGDVAVPAAPSLSVARASAELEAGRVGEREDVEITSEVRRATADRHPSGTPRERSRASVGIYESVRLRCAAPGRIQIDTHPIEKSGTVYGSLIYVTVAGTPEWLVSAGIVKDVEGRRVYINDRYCERW